MRMTPSSILSLPVYVAGTILDLIAAILAIPATLVLAGGFGCHWLADKLSADDPGYPTCDMTIEEYEEGVDVGTPKYCGNCGFVTACLRAPYCNTCDNWINEVEVNG